jgi:hypothetical protein
MDANPIGAVILALAALVVAVLIVIHYWKQITDGLRSAWNWFNKLFGNPWIRTALYMCAAPLAIIVGFIQTIVDLLQGKGWKSFLNMAGPLKAVTDALRITQAGGEWAEPGRRTPVSPNTSLINALTTTSIQKAIMDIFLHVPEGTTMKTTGGAPNITVNMGRTMGLGSAQ